MKFPSFKKLWSLLSFKWAMAFVILMLLSWFPVTGIFLLIVAGPIWIGFMVHIIAVALVVDVLRGRLPRIFLLAAIGPYFLYYGSYVLEGMRIENLRVEYAADNPNMIAQYDPSAHALVTTIPFVSEYDVPVTFGSRPHEPEGYMSKRLATGEYCQTLKEIKGRTIVASSYRNPLPNACIFMSPEKPQKPMLQIQIEKEATDNRKLHVTAYSFILDGQPINEYRAMFYARLRILPLFVSGCWLNSGRPSWECEFGFARKKIELDVYPGKNPMMDGEKGLVALLLGIRQRNTETLADFAGYPENNAVFDAILERKANEGPDDFDEWGLRKDGPYQPEIGLREGHPSFTGFVDRGPKGGPFKTFIKRHEGQVVYLDITAIPNAKKRGFTNYGVCRVDEDCSTGDDNAYHFKTEDGSWYNFEERGKFKGFFKVGAEEQVNNKHRPQDSDTRTTLTVLPNP
ncbi:MAG: hypothetical protein JKY71_03455 [Alphaproteobacteria bacterium]|nr:hypothetical protein [Alphaproteobacteria bacterium]